MGFLNILPRHLSSKGSNKERKINCGRLVLAENLSRGLDEVGASQEVRDEDGYTRVLDPFHAEIAIDLTLYKAVVTEEDLRASEEVSKHFKRVLKLLSPFSSQPQSDNSLTLPPVVGYLHRDNYIYPEETLTAMFMKSKK